MPQAGHGHANSIMSMQHFCIDRITTVNATAVTVLSIPTAINTCYCIEVEVLCYKSDFSSMHSGSVVGNFQRGTGNITKDGSLVNSLVGTLTAASILMVANTSTQTIDIQVSGLAATVVWNLGVDITYNL